MECATVRWNIDAGQVWNFIIIAFKTQNNVPVKRVGAWASNVEDLQFVPSVPPRRMFLDQSVSLKFVALQGMGHVFGMSFLSASIKPESVTSLMVSQLSDILCFEAHSLSSYNPKDWPLGRILGVLDQKTKVFGSRWVPDYSVWWTEVVSWEE